eukprot:9836049-Alexandrium_andersonii.AAC.1
MSWRHDKIPAFALFLSLLPAQDTLAEKMPAQDQLAVEKGQVRPCACPRCSSSVWGSGPRL